MVSPVPDFIYGQAKKDAAKPIDDKIYFAHTDLAEFLFLKKLFTRD
jgi:hypothetical protein